MRQCAGLPPQPPLRRNDPRILFINRRHHGVPTLSFFIASEQKNSGHRVAHAFPCAAGRSVLAMAEAYTYFRVHRAEHEHVTSKLTYMEGLTLAQQVTAQAPLLRM